MNRLKNYYKKHRKLSKLFSLLLIIVFLIVGYLGYNTYQIHADKQRFAEASVLVDKIYADIVKELGQPENHKRTNSCSRRYQEFTGYKDLTCYVDRSYTYAAQSEETAARMVSRIQLLIAKHGQLKALQTPETTFHDSISGNVVNRIISNKYSTQDMPCYVGYTYAQSGQKNVNDDKTSTLEIGISCYRPSSTEVYKTI